MAGVEAVGLILGAFPIVTSALDGYRKAFEPLKSWWKFQRTFEDFIDDVGTQRVLFDNNLEKLLAPFITSETHMGVLLNDPFGPAWQSPELDEKLQYRLGSSFPFYKTIVVRMRDTLLDLQRLLGVDDDKAIPLWRKRSPGRIEVELEFRRLRISFSKKKFDHVESLSRRNDELAKLLQSNDELAPTRKTRATSSNASLLRKLQSHALSLYGVLDNAWICPCQSHTTQLRLERRIKEKSVIRGSWKVAFPVPDKKSSDVALKEMEVRISDDDGDDSDDDDEIDQPGMLPLSKPQSGASNPIYQVRNEIEHQMAILSISSTNVNAAVANKTTSPSGAVGYKAVISATSCNSSYRHLSKHVAFANPTASVTNPNQQKSPIPLQPRPVAPSIKDICADLNSMDEMAPCLGFLQDQQNWRYTFYPLQDLVSDQHLTLHNALKLNSSQMPLKSLSRQERLTIAVVLASSLLQLHTTPWLSEGWNKDDIVLHVDTARQRVTPNPFLSAKFQSANRQKTRITTKFGTKKALSSLGIVLLELCFGKIIEDHPLRPHYFGPNNQPNAFTDISTAREWHEEVTGEVGEDMSDAIRRCLDCSFAPKPNLEDKDFQEAVFEGVILPLQDVLKVWEKN